MRILHILRAPEGGLFRHVSDLASEQARAGHEVGLVCAEGGNVLTQAMLDEIEPRLALGLHRLPMRREPGLADARATVAVRKIAAKSRADVLHGHGAKGGAYARLAAGQLCRLGISVRSFYTPHGGSLHYGADTLKGRIYGLLERWLEPLTSGILFESAYARGRYAAQIGPPKVPVATVSNGIGAADLQPRELAPDAADFLFLGELRILKGVDVMLQALAEVRKTHPARAIIVGDGPDRQAFEAQAAALGLCGAVSFTGALPARKAFTMGRVLVMPSRAESLPYVILEAGAAGIPIIASRVGGIPEVITNGSDGRLIEPGDADVLAEAMIAVLEQPLDAEQRAANLRAVIGRRFTTRAMAEAITSFYTAEARPLAKAA